MQKHINCVTLKHIVKQCLDDAETDTIVRQSLYVEANVPGSDMEKKSTSAIICCRSDSPSFLGCDVAEMPVNHE